MRLSLPLLINDDLAAMDTALSDFVARSGVRLALFIDGGGFVVTQQGDAGEMDVATLGALAANSFAATQAISNILQDHTVTSLYQEGAEQSVFIALVPDFGYLTVIFPSEAGVGLVKFFAQSAIERIGRQLAIARLRPAEQGMDFAELNVGGTGPLFKRKDV